jgi:hypothetical protein
MRKQIPILVGEATADTIEDQDKLIEGYDTSIRYHNTYFDVLKGAIEPTAKVELVKRPGVSDTVPFTLPAVLGTDRRILSAVNSPVVVGGSPSAPLIMVWTYNSGGGTLSIQVTYNSTVMAAPGGWSTTWPYGEVVAMDNATTGYAAFVYGNQNAGLISTVPAFSRITDVDCPAGIIAAEYLDGYIFVSTGDQKIYNCELNTPNTWTATGFISATGSAGSILDLKRLRNYLVAFKNNSIEFFENAGNPTPGSPLGAVKQLNKSIGTVGKAFVKRVSDGIIFVGQTDSLQMGVYKLRESDLEVEKISDQYVDAFLNTDAFHVMDFTAYASFTAGVFVLPWKGHEFYSFPNRSTVLGEGFNFVFDNANKTWQTWSLLDDSGDQYPLRAGGAVFYIYPGEIYLIPDYLNTDSQGQMPRKVLESAYQDYDSKAITVSWTSPRFNFGTGRRKHMSVASLFFSTGGYDVAADSGTITLSWYDYTGFRLVSRTVTVQDLAEEPTRAIFRRLGSFRERKFVLEHSGNQPFRLKALEVDISMAEDDID